MEHNYPYEIHIVSDAGYALTVPCKADAPVACMRARSLLMQHVMSGAPYPEGRWTGTVVECATGAVAWQEIVRKGESG